MPVELSLSLSTIMTFLAVLARVSGLVLFVPIPGFQSSSEVARVVLVLGLTAMLFPVRPAIKGDLATGGLLLTIASELALGMLVGVSMAILLEGAQLAAQFVGLQAGYSFASTIDPTTQADSSVLQVVLQLLSGFLFFALGIERDLIRVLALTPVASGTQSAIVMQGVIHLGSQMFVFGLRLAMPVLALLILMDLSFAVLNKVHAQFQVMSVSFAGKMLAGLGLSAITLTAFPQILQSVSNKTFEMLFRLLGN